MNLSRIHAVVLRQFYLLKGSPTRLLPLFVWVMIDIVLWGFFTIYLGSVSPQGDRFVPALLGAVLLWDFLTRVMQGVTMAFFEDVWSRNFLNFFATPLRVTEYIAGLVITGIATSLIGLVAMLLLAWLAFGLSFAAYGAVLIPFIMVLFVFGMALGVLGSAFVLRLGPSAEWLIWPIPAILAPFVCVFYPLSVLPVWMQAIARLLPPSYIFEAMRGIINGGPVPWISLFTASLLSLAYLAASIWVFLRVYRIAVRSGLIARYSAEAVN